MTKTVYYAHSIALYGTEQEKRDIARLEALGLLVVNPNSPAHDAGYKAHGMEYFRALVEGCDSLAFRANFDGSVNAGVHAEVKWVEEMGKPVIELPTWVRRNVLTVEQTRAMLAETGHR